ncbi:hypothetical protein LTR03_005125 [Friedmanniomyces endolithicus]|nr:hypothetical protein LTR03_005125 [Friedmanniomyces endolithicus]
MTVATAKASLTDLSNAALAFSSSKVFAEIAVVVREVVEGEDVVGGFEFGDGYETDLWVGWGGKFGGESTSRSQYGTTLTQLASSAVFLSPSSQSTTALTTTPVANPPNPLHVLRDAALLVKAHTTKLSLLAITAPFTPSAISKVLRQLAAESLPAMLSAVHICRQEHAVWGTMMATEAQSRVRRVYKEMETLLQEILALSQGQGHSSKTRNSLSSTAVVWETCDALVALSMLGISGLAVQKAEQYRDTVQDAIEELREWAAGEDQETEGHDALLDDNDEGVEGDRDSLMEEIFHAANSLPADRVELEELVEEAGRRLKRVVLLYTAVVKRRLKTFEEGDATVGRLDEAVEGLRRIPHLVDELAACGYEDL